MMETITLYDFQLDFLRELLREHMHGKKSDLDTRLMSKDILDTINTQAPEKAYEMSLLTGELMEVE